MPRHPHKLDLYRLAVQHPFAEANFLVNTYAHYNAGRWPTRLKEDFAGAAAVANAWADLDHDQTALAVELHAPTLRRAAKHPRVTLRCADVLDVRSPRVDVIAALNFSAFIYHTRADMLRYLRHCRRCLRPGGIVALDAFGGPGAMRLGIQSRTIHPPRSEGVAPFTYQWEQRSFNAVSARIDCRIHFKLKDGRVLHSAFRYDWRLWTLAELIEGMNEAGFPRAEVWCNRCDPVSGVSSGVYEPLSVLPAREDWVAYVVGVLENG